MVSMFGSCAKVSGEGSGGQGGGEPGRDAGGGVDVPDLFVQMDLICAGLAQTCGSALC